MAHRYDNESERQGFDRDRERERARWEARDRESWRESQGNFEPEYGRRGDWGPGREGYRSDFENRGQGRHEYRDWELGRSSDWDRGEEQRDRTRGWSRNQPRGGNPGAEGGDLARRSFGEQWGRDRDYEGGGTRYEGQHYYGQPERYGSISGHWAGGMGTSRGDQFGYQNQMGGIGQGGSQGGYRNDVGGYTGLGGGGYGSYGSYGGALGQYYGGGRHTGRGPKGYQRSDDRIREDVNERLTQHPDIDATEIDVQVQNGEVTLAGTVDHRHTKRLAEDVAESVSGVREVHNQIRLHREENRESQPNVGVAGGTASTSFGGDAERFSSHSITPEPAGAGGSRTNRK